MIGGRPIGCGREICTSTLLELSAARYARVAPLLTSSLVLPSDPWTISEQLAVPSRSVSAEHFCDPSANLTICPGTTASPA
jgi:hypothetical protein